MRTRLALACPACGHVGRPAEVLRGGGAALAGVAPASPPPPPLDDTSPGPAGPAATPSSFREATPASYTPKHLAEKILTSKSAIEGERKQVTVMFTDVSGFTAMSEHLDPEEVHAIMDRAFEVILAAVHAYEGTINQFLGDGVMALFGAPIAHEDHARRALERRAGDPGGARSHSGRTSSGRTGATSACGWGSTPARRGRAPSAATCGWTTRRWATP